MTKWFSVCWWVYLLRNLKKQTITEAFQIIICRAKGHPNGPVYYTGPCAPEPDWSCKDCGEHLN